jgi:hypothetical protein
MIYIDVPDIERYGRLHDLHIAHLYHFCSRTLRAMLTTAGYLPHDLEAHTPIMHPPSIRVLAYSTKDAGPEPSQQTLPSSEELKSRGREGWQEVFKIELKASCHRRKWPLHRRLSRVLMWIIRAPAVYTHIRWLEYRTRPPHE